jgi:hypothetical protein
LLSNLPTQWRKGILWQPERTAGQTFVPSGVKVFFG